MRMCNKFLNNKKSVERGFTLLEMLIAVGIFSIVATGAIGAILVSVDANRKSNNTRNALDSVQFAIDDMTQNIRYGSDYAGGGTLLSLKGASGETIVYRKSAAGTLERSTDGGTTYLPLTDSSVTILGVDFLPLNTPQYPRVLIRIQGRSGDVSKGTRKEFSVQTTVAKRNAIAQ